MLIRPVEVNTHRLTVTVFEKTQTDLVNVVLRHSVQERVVNNVGRILAGAKIHTPAIAELVYIFYDLQHTVTYDLRPDSSHCLIHRSLHSIPYNNRCAGTGTPKAGIIGLLLLPHSQRTEVVLLDL